MPKQLDSSAKSIEEFIQMWSAYAQENPDIKLGAWLNAFAIMTGLSMYMGDMTEELIDPALDSMAEVVVNTFNNANKHVAKTPLQ